MTDRDRWWPTQSLSRALTVPGVGIALAVLFGGPVVVVLVAPLAMMGALALLWRPTGIPTLTLDVDHRQLHEGQSTTTRLAVHRGAPDDQIEHVTRAVRRAPYVSVRPASGVAGATSVRGSSPTIDVAVVLGGQRWGRREVDDERVVAHARWAGFRWEAGPVAGPGIWVLPQRAAFDLDADLPTPVGLVGAHRSRRGGDGIEFEGIRPFRVGDRLKRINWRTTLRSGETHVVTTQAEHDAGVLIVVDALADYGRSGGIDGRASSLDVTVRAAGAVAEHFSRLGDRVGLRVVADPGDTLPMAAGRHQVRRLQMTLARIRPATPVRWDGLEAVGAVRAGTTVVVISPLMTEQMATAAVDLMRRGLPVLVIDPVVEGFEPTPRAGVDPALARLAWRMRNLERRAVLEKMAAVGCPVVVWRGPGTIDEVMRGLAKRRSVPRVVQ